MIAGTSAGHAETDVFYGSNYHTSKLRMSEEIDHNNTVYTTISISLFFERKDNLKICHVLEESIASQTSVFLSFCYVPRIFR